MSPTVPLIQRFEVLLVSALSQVLADLSLPLHGGRIQCLIGLPEARPGCPANIGRLISAAVSRTFGIPASCVYVVERGHAAGCMALQAAAGKITSGESDMCIVAGVDSYHQAETLEWLDESGFLMSPQNRNGFPPGEAAGACLLASSVAVARYGLAMQARLRGAATAMELNTIRGTEACVGTGLSAALKDALAALRRPEELVTATYCDLNGERYRSEEFTYTLLRVQEAFVDAHDYVCPADCWGDVGAASAYYSPRWQLLLINADTPADDIHCFGRHPGRVPCCGGVETRRDWSTE